jgi:hypothetical protein
MIIKKKKIGKFSIDGSLIEGTINNRYIGLSDILNKFIIIRAEYLYHINAVEYIAYSELFEEVPELSAVPIYEIELTLKHLETVPNYSIILLNYVRKL